ncbi:unnamed protein product, partial [Lampetra planeri]
VVPHCFVARSPGRRRPAESVPHQNPRDPLGRRRTPSAPPAPPQCRCGGGGDGGRHPGVDSRSRSRLGRSQRTRALLQHPAALHGRGGTQRDAVRREGRLLRLLHEHEPGTAGLQS